MKVIMVTAEPEKLGVPYVILRELEGRGFECEVEVPDPIIEDSKTYKLLKRIAVKVGVQDIETG